MKLVERDSRKVGQHKTAGLSHSIIIAKFSP